MKGVGDIMSVWILYRRKVIFRELKGFSGDYSWIFL